MARPAGVTTIAILCFAGASFCVLSGTRLIAGSNFIGTFFRERHDNATSNLAELGAILIFLLVVLTVLYAAAGWGLWKLRGWGRVLTIVLVTLGATFDLLRRFLSPHFKSSSFVEAAVTLTLYGMIAWYLVKPEVKAMFTRT